MASDVVSLPPGHAHVYCRDHPVSSSRAALSQLAGRARVHEIFLHPYLTPAHAHPLADLRDNLTFAIEDLEVVAFGIQLVVRRPHGHQAGVFRGGLEADAGFVIYDELAMGQRRRAEAVRSPLLGNTSLPWNTSVSYEEALAVEAWDEATVVREFFARVWESCAVGPAPQATASEKATGAKKIGAYLIRLMVPHSAPGKRELPRTRFRRSPRTPRYAPVLCAPPTPLKGYGILRASYVIVALSEG